MADADFDGFGGGFSTTGQGGAPSLQRYVNIAGAASSLALVIGLGFWGYKLAVRDVTGVPVVQALDGPMRIAPQEPGGEVADYQGLAVNEVAEVGTAAPPPDRLILAPRPVELSLEDAAGLAGQPVPEVAPDVAPASAMVADPDLALAVDPVAESADPTEVAVEAALAEALGLEPVAEAPALETLDEGGALSRSLRPKARPGRTAAPVEAVALAAPVEVDAGTLATGTRLVQFGAFDTQDEAKAEWTRLQGRFTDLMAGKAMVVQAAESGGRTFFRLRAHGFEDEADARRFCSAFIAENAACIPVAQR
jgi:SPOR domain